VGKLRLLVKALRPLPDKWKGIADTELKYRRRYVDLAVSEESRAVFRTRTTIVQYLRAFLDALDFLEVETPMMQVIPGGAVAKPFVTHHNALGIDMYLRIAPELYLKRLLVGGFERVYEINRNFRNEGLSTQHNPEFTMLELYQAYADYQDFMDLVERMFRGIADAVAGNRQITYQGRQFDFSKPFRRVSVEDAILERNHDLAASSLRDLTYLHRVCERLGIPCKPHDGAGKLQIEIFEKTASRRSSSRPSCSPTQRKSRRFRAAMTRIRSSRTASNSSSADGSWRTVFPSSTIRKTRRSAFATRPRARRRATRKRCSTTRTTSVRSSTACRRRRTRRRHRPARHALHRLALDPRRAAVPADAAGDLNKSIGRRHSNLPSDRSVRFRRRRPHGATCAARRTAG